MVLTEYSAQTGHLVPLKSKLKLKS